MGCCGSKNDSLGSNNSKNLHPLMQNPDYCVGYIRKD